MLTRAWSQSAWTKRSAIAFLARLARVDVLVLDDWGLGAVTERHRHDLLEILEDRDGTRSTVITSQLPRERWHDYLGDPTVADAILDRLVHRAHSLALGGPSRRKTEPPTKPSTD
jgi:DNA replication protein DnaC